MADIRKSKKLLPPPRKRSLGYTVPESAPSPPGLSPAFIRNAMKDYGRGFKVKTRGASPVEKVRLANTKRGRGQKYTTSDKQLPEIKGLIPIQRTTRETLLPPPLPKSMDTETKEEKLARRKKEAKIFKKKHEKLLPPVDRRGEVTVPRRTAPKKQSVADIRKEMKEYGRGTNVVNRTPGVKEKKRKENSKNTRKPPHINSDPLPDARGFYKKPTPGSKTGLPPPLPKQSGSNHKRTEQGPDVEEPKFEKEPSWFQRKGLAFGNFFGGDFDGLSDYEVQKQMGMRPTRAVRGYNPNLSGIANVTRKDAERIKQLEINEASKYVRHLGDNVDPFNPSTDAKIVRNKRRAQAIIESGGHTVESYGEQYDADRYRYTLMKNADDLTEVEKDELKKLKTQVDEAENLYRSASNSQVFNFKHAKDFRPRESASGYGLGATNYMNASGRELLTRGMYFTIGVGGKEALLNSFGILTANQKSYYNMVRHRGIMARVFSNAVGIKAFGMGGLAFSALQGEDFSSFVTTQLTGAAGLQGWRVGSSFAGAVFSPKGRTLGGIGANMLDSPLKSTWNYTKMGLFRGGVGVLGGVTGFALGAALVQGTSAVITDMISSDSKIRKVAKNFSRRTSTMNMVDSHDTLTGRQAALSKLAKSGLNDRALLFGNEARVMRGLM